MSARYCILLSAGTPLFAHVEFAFKHVLPGRIKSQIDLIQYPLSANDKQLAKYVADNSTHSTGQAILGCVCDPVQAASARLNICAALVKRLGFLILHRQSLKRDAVEFRGLQKIYAHGEQKCAPAASFSPSSSAQALAKCMALYFGADQAQICGYPYDDIPKITEKDIIVTCNFPAALYAGNKSGLVIRHASHIFPEWSRAFLSGLACRRNLDKNSDDVELLKEVIGALTKACFDIRFCQTPDQFAKVLKTLYPTFRLGKRLINLDTELAKQLSNLLLKHRYIPSDLELGDLAGLQISALWKPHVITKYVLFDPEHRLKVLGAEGIRSKITDALLRNYASNARRKMLQGLQSGPEVGKKQPLRVPIDIAVITARKEEHAAVKSKLLKFANQSVSKEAYELYTIKKSSSKDTRKKTIALFCLNYMGRLRAAILTLRKVIDLSPGYVFVVGIAGGVKERVDLGDILLPRTIVDYEMAKVQPQGDDIRWREYPMSQSLFDKVDQIAAAEKWKSRIDVARPDGTPNTVTECHYTEGRHVIFSGDKIVAQKSIIDKYLSTHPEGLGIEMEGAGVAAALESLDGNKPEFYMIRSVSDFADEDKNTQDVEKWRAFACDSAAAFLAELIVEKLS